MEPTDPSPCPCCCPSQGILRTGLEEVRQFFALNGSCRLPLSPSLLVKGIVSRVSDQRAWGPWRGERSVEVRSSLTRLLRETGRKAYLGPRRSPAVQGLLPSSCAGWRDGAGLAERLVMLLGWTWAGDVPCYLGARAAPSAPSAACWSLHRVLTRLRKPLLCEAPSHRAVN